MKIYALIGASGTGKSHRASMVAVDKGVDTIIDDGLLIHNGRIIAGYSAKREETRIAAVKRAIMTEPGHARQVLSGIRAIHPRGILILGTSKNMVYHILEALELSAESIEWTLIEDISSVEEREIARRIRTQEGKHVIPAPTMEVKKSFSGYLVDPLRFMFRGKGRQMEVEKSIVRPTFSGMGRFYISDTVITAIVVHVVRGTKGIVRVSRIVVQSSPDGVLIQMELTIGQTQKIFSLLDTVQQRVVQEVEVLTSLNVVRVRVQARRLVPDFSNQDGGV